MIPAEQRGRMLGFAGAAGNIIALGAAAWIGVLLKGAPYPYNYTIIFLIGLILLFVDVLDFKFMVEAPDKIMEKYSGYFEHIKNFPVNLKNNKKVMNTIIGNTFIAISNIALGYYTIYAIRIYHAKAEQVAFFTGIGVVSNILGSIAFGFLADKYGHKQVLRLAALFNIAAGLSIIGIHSIFGVYTAFAFSMLCSSGFNLSSGVMVMHNSNSDKIAVYTSANSMITMGMYSIVMVLSSVIIDHFTFIPIFITVSLVSFAAFMVYTMSRIEA